MLSLLAELDARLRTAVDDLRLQRLTSARWAISATRICRPSSSISARTASIATRRTTPSAGPIAPCSTPCSTRWSAGPRRCWCSPAEEVWGTRYPGRGAACICSNGRRSPQARRRARAQTGPHCARFATTVTEAIEPLAPRQDRRVEPGGRGRPARRGSDAPDLAELFITATSHERRCADRDQDRLTQMRALLAASARSRRGRRSVRSLRGGGQWLTHSLPRHGELVYGQVAARSARPRGPSTMTCGMVREPPPMRTLGPSECA